MSSRGCIERLLIWAMHQSGSPARNLGLVQSSTQVKLRRITYLALCNAGCRADQHHKGGHMWYVGQQTMSIHVSSWPCIIMVMYHHGHVSSRSCIIMVMFHHGHVSSWSCFIMVMFHHGHVSSWSCIFMVMYHHGHVSSWSCFIMVMYHHGHHKQADTRHKKTGTHQLRESGRRLQFGTHLSSVGNSPLCSLRL